MQRDRRRKAKGAAEGRAQETRTAIMLAARDVLLEQGYAAARVEDIIVRAGVSRPTFYRHFNDKFDVARAYHSMSRGVTMEPWTLIASRDFNDRAEVRRWLEAIAESFEERRNELVVWSEMSTVEQDYVHRVPRQTPQVIEALAGTIPAFARALDDAPDEDAGLEPGPVWIEAYFLLDQISYQLSTSVLRSQIISHADSIAYFAERFKRFVARHGGKTGA